MSTATTPKRRKMMLHLAEAALARYERVCARGRAHPPDFNALMMRICAGIVEERDKGKTLVEVLDEPDDDGRLLTGAGILGVTHESFEAPIRQSRRGTR